MVNTRRTGSGQQQGQNNQGANQPLPMPPPLTPEQFFQLQMQMMATLNNTVQAMQQVHAQPPPPPPPQQPHTSDPLQTDDWLRAVERQLDIAHCDEPERVLNAAG